MLRSNSGHDRKNVAERPIDRANGAAFVELRTDSAQLLIFIERPIAARSDVIRMRAKRISGCPRGTFQAIIDLLASSLVMSSAV